MARRALPAGLALAAFVADVQAAHGVALLLLLVAIPAAFVLTLDCYGDTVAARCGLLRPALAAGGLASLVFSAALRSPAVVGGVPRVAVSAIVLALMLCAAAAVAAPRPRVRVAARVGREDEPERLAA